MNCFQDKLAEGCLVELKRWFSRRSGTQSGHHSTSTPAQSPFKDSMTIMKQWQQESAQKKRALGEEENNIPEDANGHQQSHHNKKKPRVEEKAMAVEEEKEEKTAAEVSSILLKNCLCPRLLSSNHRSLQTKFNQFGRKEIK